MDREIIAAENWKRFVRFRTISFMKYHFLDFRSIYKYYAALPEERNPSDAYLKIPLDSR